VTVTATLGALTKSVTLSLSAAQVPGHHWDVSQSSNPRWNYAAYADGRFVAVGSAGGIETSTDGKTWTRVDTLDATWECVTWGAAGWVAFGFRGQVGTSPDGVTWTMKPHVLPGADVVHVRQAAFGNGVYVAVSDTQSFVSADGQAWTPGQGATRTVAFGNGLFVASTSGALGYSVDGTHWTSAAVSNGFVPIVHVAFGNGTFIATGADGEEWVSTDGKTWAVQSAVVPSFGMFGFTGFARGNFYVENESAAGIADVSADGVSWTSSSLSVGGLVSLAASADTFVSVQYGGGIASGPDVGHLAAFGGDPMSGWAAADYAGGRFIAIAFDYTIETSVDGIAWGESAVLPVPPGYGSGNLYALAHAPDGSLVSAGSAEAFGVGVASHFVDSYGYSHDGGTTWTYTVVDKDPLAADVEAMAVIHNGASFVSIDSAGQLRYSLAGHGWADLGRLPSSVTSIPTGLAFGNGHYATVGYGGLAAGSRDGKDWTVAPPSRSAAPAASISSASPSTAGASSRSAPTARWPPASTASRGRPRPRRPPRTCTPSNR
jgi:hypothetical protein